MKHLLCTTLLVAGLAGNVLVYGQVKVEVKEKKDPVRVMRPDHMPCLVADLSGVEPMPVKKLNGRMVRPMPNGMPDGRPRLEVVPRRKKD